MVLLLPSRFVFLVGIIFSALSCKQKEEKVETNQVRQEIKDSVPAIPVQDIKVSYHIINLDDSVRNVFGRTYDSIQLAVILAVNRVDINRLHKVDSMVIPDTFVADFNAYSPFPKTFPLIDSVEKLLLCSYPVQAVAAYDHGKLVRWLPASFGKRSTPTPLGLFHTNWKAKQTISTVNEEWILNWYFNIGNETGVSLHQYELPGHPASHSCIRLGEQDARWLYYWAEQWKLFPDGKLLAYGTPVIVYGSYDYNSGPPWYKLPNDSSATALTLDSLNKNVQPYLRSILDRQAHRDSVEVTLNASQIALQKTLK
jgi:hypothetical protein